VVASRADQDLTPSFAKLPTNNTATAGLKRSALTGSIILNTHPP